MPVGAVIVCEQQHERRPDREPAVAGHRQEPAGRLARAGSAAPSRAPAPAPPAAAPARRGTANSIGTNTACVGTVNPPADVEANLTGHRDPQHIQRGDRQRKASPHRRRSRQARTRHDMKPRRRAAPRGARRRASAARGRRTTRGALGFDVGVSGHVTAPHISSQRSPKKEQWKLSHSRTGNILHWNNRGRSPGLQHLSTPLPSRWLCASWLPIRSATKTEKGKLAARRGRKARGLEHEIAQPPGNARRLLVFSYSSRPRSGRVPRRAPRAACRCASPGVLAEPHQSSLCPPPQHRPHRQAPHAPPPTLSQPFLRWGDSSSVRARDRRLLRGLAGGLDPQRRRPARSRGASPSASPAQSAPHSLGLAAGASAQSPFTCVDASYQTFRFFARNSRAQRPGSSSRWSTRRRSDSYPSPSGASRLPAAGSQRRRCRRCRRGRPFVGRDRADGAPLH